MELIPKAIARPVGRLGAAAQNALEFARFGGLDTDEEPSPYEIVAEHRVYRLRRYYPAPADAPAGHAIRPAVMLIPPMMLAAEVGRRLAGDERRDDPAPARHRSLGGGLRRPRA